MHKNIEPLVNDGFDGQHAKRVLSYIQSQREKGTSFMLKSHSLAESP